MIISDADLTLSTLIHAGDLLNIVKTCSTVEFHARRRRKDATSSILNAEMLTVALVWLLASITIR